MSDTATLVAFLKARLDEDEQVAKRAPDIDDVDSLFVIAGDEAEWLGINVSRVLAEVESKRRTIVRCEEEMMSGIPRLVHFAKQTLWEMTRPYADHADYREEWRP